VAGRPLIAYTIDAATASRRLTRVIVSTEDEEIAGLARSLGAEVPFRRPLELAADDASSADVACHALAFVENDEGSLYDCVTLLEPTSPLREARDIDAALALFFESGADSVVSLCRLEAPHPAKLKVIDNGKVKPFLPHLWREGLRRQDLEPVYFLNGAVYVVKKEMLVRKKTFWSGNTVPYVMPPERSVNIDSWVDLQLAESLLQDRAVQNGGGR